MSRPQLPRPARRVRGGDTSDSRTGLHRVSRKSAVGYAPSSGGATHPLASRITCSAIRSCSSGQHRACRSPGACRGNGTASTLRGRIGDLPGVRGRFGRCGRGGGVPSWRHVDPASSSEHPDRGEHVDPSVDPLPGQDRTARGIRRSLQRPARPRRPRLPQLAPYTRMPRGNIRRCIDLERLHRRPRRWVGRTPR